MKIFAIADLHGEESILDRLRVIGSKKDYKHIIIAGDLTDKGPVSYAEEVLELVQGAYAVHGNMDPPEVLELLEKKGASIHGKKVKLGQWNLVGWGASNPTPFGTPSEMSEDEIEKGLRDAGVDKFSILVTHAPPKGMFDSVGGDMHVGSTAIRKIIEEKKPILNICAHIHEHKGEDVLDETLVVKLPPASTGIGAEITIDDGIEVNFIRC